MFDSGDVDAVVPVTSTRYSINSLKLPVNVAWRPWYSQNEVLMNNNTHFHTPISSMDLQGPQFCLSIGNLFFSQNWMHSITSLSHSCIKKIDRHQYNIKKTTFINPTQLLILLYIYIFTYF